MTNALWDVQEQIFNTLCADSDIQNLLGNPARIYDYVPADVIFPYLVISEIDVSPFDTCDRYGYEQYYRFESFSRQHGSKETKQILQAVVDCLRGNSLTLNGHALVDCRLQGIQTKRLKDGKTTFGTTRLVIITQEII